MLTRYSRCSSPSALHANRGCHCAALCLLRFAHPHKTPGVPRHTNPSPRSRVRRPLQAACSDGDWRSFRCDALRSMPLLSIDPSLALGFYCRDLGETLIIFVTVTNPLCVAGWARVGEWGYAQGGGAPQACPSRRVQAQGTHRGGRLHPQLLSMQACPVGAKVLLLGRPAELRAAIRVGEWECQELADWRGCKHAMRALRLLRRPASARWGF